MNRPPSKPPRILSLGSINADFEVRVDAPLGEAETAAARDLRRLGGGKAANVAVVARLLGCDVCLLGRVGDDDLAVQALRPLQEVGIDLGAVRRAAGERTAFAFIAVPPSGDKRIVLAGEANLGFDDADIEAVCKVIGTADPASVLVVDYEISPRAASQAVRAAHQRGLRVVIDPSFPARVDHAALRLAYALTPNESEARALTGVKGRGADAAAAAARALAELGPPVVCIKLDGGGCLLRHRGRSWRVGSHPAGRVVDSTGAGDAFTGALAVALFEGQNVPQAAAFAVAASDLAVSAYGSQPAYPSRERLQQQLRTGRQASGTAIEH